MDRSGWVQEGKLIEFVDELVTKSKRDGGVKVFIMFNLVELLIKVRNIKRQLDIGEKV